MPMKNERQIIYVLCHEYTRNIGDPDSEEDELKQLYYSFSKKSCSDQISSYINLPGYKDYPNGFRVLEIETETRYFESGFVEW
jgi:hypothetical protein